MKIIEIDEKKQTRIYISTDSNYETLLKPKLSSFRFLEYWQPYRTGPRWILKNSVAGNLVTSD